jgi:site-specific recombinase XerD
MLQFPTPASGGPSIEAALASYLRDCRVRNLSPRTIAGYEDVVGRFTRFTAEIGVVYLAELGVDHARAWIESRGALAPASRAGYVRTLRAWSAWCAGEYEQHGDRLARLRAPRVPQRLPRLLSDDEIGALLTAAPPETRFAIVLLWETGLRASEAVGVDLADIGPEGILVRHAKGGKERRVPMSSALRAETQAYLRGVRPAYVEPEETALLIGRRGRRLSANGLAQALERVAAAVGVKGASPHQWRRQFAHDYCYSGGQMFALRDTLGHTSLEMVSVYARTTPEDLARGVEAHSPLSARGIRTRPRAASLRARGGNLDGL